MDGDIVGRNALYKQTKKNCYSVFSNLAFSFYLFVSLWKLEEKPRTGKINKEIAPSAEKTKNEPDVRNSHKRTMLHREYHWNYGCSLGQFTKVFYLGMLKKFPLQNEKIQCNY